MKHRSSRTGWRASRLLVVLPLILGACSDPADPTRPTMPPSDALAARAPKSSALSVTISGLPDAVPAAVTVAGPGGYTTTIDASTTLTGLPRGTYTVSASPVSQSENTYTPSSATQEVTLNGRAGAVTVAYAVVSKDAGALGVTVAGLPSGAAAAVTITGASGYTRSLTSSETLTNLPAGTYTVAAADVAVGGTQYAATPATADVAVTAGGAATATVTYAAVTTEPTTGSLAVSVSGLPWGAAAAIVVTGPSGFTTSVSASQTLGGLATGTYTIAAGTVVSGATTYSASPSSQAASVNAGATATASVVYSAVNTPNPPTSGPNLRIDGVYLTQVVQTMSGSVPLISNRDGLLRVFVVADAANSVRPTVRVRFYKGGSLVSTLTASPSVNSVPTAVQEGSLNSSWNVTVPGALIGPGLSVLADVDPSNAIGESNEADNSFPASGSPLSFDVRALPDFAITFVPVLQSATGLMGDVSESNKEQFISTARQMLPVARIDANVHAPYTTSQVLSSDGNGWSALLSEINMLRAADGSARNYYGVVKGSGVGGVAGMGYIAWPAALGWDLPGSAGYVAAHEIGHNLGRPHSPCGGVSGADPAYPYPGGTLGAYGYDITSGQLLPPSTYDLMGYCSPNWISDYTYRSMLDHRAGSARVISSMTSSGAQQPSLIVWGRITASGEMILEPSFQVEARPMMPARRGPYTVEGLSANGAAVFSLSFDAELVSDGPAAGERHFAFAVPLSEVAHGRLATLRLTGAGRSIEARQVVDPTGAQRPSSEGLTAEPDGRGRVRVRWDSAAHPMVVVRDPRTRQVLSVARGGSVDVSTTLDDIELVLSDRVQSQSRRVVVRRR